MIKTYQKKKYQEGHVFPVSLTRSASVYKHIKNKMLQDLKICPVLQKKCTSDLHLHHQLLVLQKPAGCRASQFCFWIYLCLYIDKLLKCHESGIHCYYQISKAYRDSIYMNKMYLESLHSKFGLSLNLKTTLVQNGQQSHRPNPEQLLLNQLMHVDIYHCNKLVRYHSLF